MVEKRHDKKFNNLIKEKSIAEGTEENPNKTIRNFSSHVLSNEEHETLKFGLKHGLARRPEEDDILATVESLWYQIETKGLCRDGPFINAKPRTN